MWLLREKLSNNPQLADKQIQAIKRLWNSACSFTNVPDENFAEIAQQVMDELDPYLDIDEEDKLFIPPKIWIAAAQIRVVISRVIIFTSGQLLKTEGERLLWYQDPCLEDSLASIMGESIYRPLLAQKQEYASSLELYLMLYLLILCRDFLKGTARKSERSIWDEVAKNGASLAGLLAASL